MAKLHSLRVMNQILLCLTLLGIFCLNYSKAHVTDHVFNPTPISNEVEGIAESVLEHVQPFFHVGGIGGSDCQLYLNHIYHAESKMIAEDMAYKFDLKITSSGDPPCMKETKTCIGIQILAPALCKDPFEPCFKLIDENQILCIPDLTVEPSGNPGEFKEILDPSMNHLILNIAQESTKFLYHLFNTSKPCPLHIAKIVSVREQIINGINYELNIQVETNGADFDCEYSIKQCENLRVHHPLPDNCPFGRQFCLVPVNLEEVTCMEINTMVY